MNYWWRQIKVSEVAEVVLGCFIYVKSGKAQIKACDFLHKLNHSDSFPSKKTVPPHDGRFVAQSSW